MKFRYWMLFPPFWMLFAAVVASELVSRMIESFIKTLDEILDDED